MYLLRQTKLVFFVFLGACLIIYALSGIFRYPDTTAIRITDRPPDQRLTITLPDPDRYVGEGKPEYRELDYPDPIQTSSTVESAESDPGSWGTRLLPEELQDVDPGDPRLLEEIRKHWLVPPSELDLNLTRPENVDFSQVGQSVFVDHLLDNLTGGFYIECGADDGEKISNSLYFERERNWTGLLIEGNPISFQSLLHKRRQSFKLNACLSPGPNPMVANFTGARSRGGLKRFLKDVPFRKGKYQGDFLVQCFPLYSILLAMDLPHVNYFSLDVEGAEYGVLSSLHFDDVSIDVIGVETKVEGDVMATEEKEWKMERLLVMQGFRRVDAPFKQDLIMKKMR